MRRSIQTRSRIAGTLLALALTATACGTTTSTAGPETALGSDGLGATSSGGLNPDAADAVDAQDGIEGSAYSRSAGSQSLAPQTSTAVDGAPNSPQNSTERAPNSKGVRAAGGPPMQIGIGVAPTDTNDAFENAGLSAIKIPDSKSMYRVLIADLNRRGGIGGRQLEPVFATTPIVVTPNYNSQMQDVCTKWTQDAKVTIAFALAHNVLAECLQKRGVPLLAGVGYQDSQLLKSLKLLVLTHGPELARMGRSVGRAMATSDYLEGESEAAAAKIGLVTVDAPPYSRAAAEMRRELTTHGHKIQETLAVTDWSNNGDSSGMQAQISSGVLRFRSLGITHVAFLTTNGSEARAWMTQAENQGYRPRYFLNTTLGPQVLRGIVPKEQIGTARGLGWTPAADAPRKSWPYSSAQHKRCLAVLAKGDITVASDLDYYYAYAACGTTWLAEAMLVRASTINGAALIGALEGLGDQPTSLLTFSTRFGPDRHDAPQSARTFRYASSCECFEYFGGVRALQ